MYINRVEITNIRSVENFEMDFNDPAGWHVLIGDNGSGKTTILRAIALALIGGKEALALRFDWRRWVSKNKTDGHIHLKLTRDKKHDIPTYGGTIRNKRIDLQNAPVTFDNDINFNSDGNKATISGHDDASLLGYRYNWNTVFGFFSSSFGPFRRFSGGSGEGKDLFRNDDLKRLSAHLSLFDESIALTETTEWLMKLRFQELEQKGRQLELIKELINSPGFLPDNTKLNEVSSDGVSFTDSNGSIIFVNELSDGFRSMLSLTFELLRQIFAFYYSVDDVFETASDGKVFVNVPGVVLIDEIDAHLHPTWQTRIGCWFTKYFPKIQFIVTTHSPLICRACEKGSIWRLTPTNSKITSGEVVGIDKEKLVFGNILDAYGTEVFGKSAVRSVKTDDKLQRLGHLNMLYALNKISTKQDAERSELMKILSTDDPTGF